MIARDPDLQGDIVYDLRGVAPGTDFFDIDAETGWIYVSAPFDTQIATTYTISINHLIARHLAC